MNESMTQCPLRSCEDRFETILKAIDKLQDNDSSIKDNEIKQISMTLVRFEEIIKKQDETNKTLMQEVKESRKQFTDMLQHNNETVQKITNNMLEMSNNLSILNDSHKELEHSINSINGRIDELDNRGKINFIKVLNNAITLALQTGFIFIIVYAITNMKK